MLDVVPALALWLGLLLGVFRAGAETRTDQRVLSFMLTPAILVLALTLYRCGQIVFVAGWRNTGAALLILAPILVFVALGFACDALRR